MDKLYFSPQIDLPLTVVSMGLLLLHIPANGPIRAESDTEIVGLAFDYDTVLPNTVDTPHGSVEFIQGFGLIQSEIDLIMSETKTVEQVISEHRKDNPYLITDLNRTAG